MTPRTKLTVSPYSMAMYGSSNIIPNTGNVGLGTLSPQAVVHIKDFENNSGEDLLLILRTQLRRKIIKKSFTKN